MSSLAGWLRIPMVVKTAVERAPAATAIQRPGAGPRPVIRRARIKGARAAATWRAEERAPRRVP
jgi:hypothetical protein